MNAFYRDLILEARGLLSEERDPIANAANLAALIWQRLKHLNWAGFYFARGEELVLGPFQGKPACVRIAFGRGVCGTAAVSRSMQIVPDVHAFAGHIACDADSRSELVVPLIERDRLVGVLDLDSPYPDRFKEMDGKGISALANLWLEATDLGGFYEH